MDCWGFFTLEGCHPYIKSEFRPCKSVSRPDIKSLSIHTLNQCHVHTSSRCLVHILSQCLVHTLSQWAIYAEYCNASDHKKGRFSQYFAYNAPLQPQILGEGGPFCHDWGSSVLPLNLPQPLQPHFMWGEVPFPYKTPLSNLI